MQILMAFHQTNTRPVWRSWQMQEHWGQGRTGNVLVALARARGLVPEGQPRSVYAYADMLQISNAEALGLETGWDAPLSWREPEHLEHFVRLTEPEVTRFLACWHAAHAAARRLSVDTRPEYEQERSDQHGR